MVKPDTSLVLDKLRSLKLDDLKCALLGHRKKVRDALPHLEFTQKRNELRQVTGSAPNLDIRSAYTAALRELEDNNPQVPGISRVVDEAVERAAAQNVSKANPVSERLKKALDTELAKYKADHERRCAELSKQIKALREEAEALRGQAQGQPAAVLTTSRVAKSDDKPYWADRKEPDLSQARYEGMLGIQLTRARQAKDGSAR